MTEHWCAKCGESPAGPGRVLCPECKAAIEKRNHQMHSVESCANPGKHGSD